MRRRRRYLILAIVALLACSAHAVAQRSDTDVEENLDAWVIPVSGGAPVKVSDTGFRVSRPRWSPDGRRIAYVGAADWEAIPKIRLAPAAGGPSTIVSRDFTFMTDLTWSDDGKALWAEAPLKGEEHLVRVDLATGLAVPVTSGPRCWSTAQPASAAGTSRGRAWWRHSTTPPPGRCHRPRSTRSRET